MNTVKDKNIINIHDKINILLIDRNHVDLNELNDKFLEYGLFNVLGKTSTYSLAMPLINRNKPHFVILGVEGSNPADVEMIEEIHLRFTHVKVIVIGKNLDAHQILDYFRAGASEYLEKNSSKETVLKIFTKLYTVKTQKPDIVDNSDVIGVWGASGGCGTTTVAANLAYLLQESAPTVVVDLNFWQRDLSIFFDLHPNYTLQDVINASKRIDEALLREMIVKYKNGLSVLPLSIDQPLKNLDNVNLEAIIELLKINYRYVVLDLGHLDMIDNQLFYIINKQLLVVNQTLPNLYLVLRKLRFLYSINFAKEDICLVLNKFINASEISIKHIEKTLDFTNINLINEDAKIVSKAINAGKSIFEVKRRSYSAKDLIKLADYLTENIKDKRNKKAEGLKLAPLPEKTSMASRLLTEG